MSLPRQCTGSAAAMVLLTVLMTITSAVPIAAPRHVWVERATMPYPVSDMSTTTVGDNIYIVGGCVSNQTWDVAYGMYSCDLVTANSAMYSPSTDVWTELPASPRQRYRHAAAAVGSSLYIFGGRTLYDDLIPEVDVFDTVEQTWSTLSSPLPTSVSDQTAFVLNDVIYVAGGWNAAYEALTIVQTYTPATDAWSTASPMVHGRGDVGSGVVDGVAYVFGGFTDVNNYEAPLSTLEVLESDVWVVHTEPAEAARGDKAVVPLHNRLLVMGGETKVDGNTSPLSDIEAFDPTAGTDEDAWQMVSQLWAPRFRFNAAAYGDSAFIFGGQEYLRGQSNTEGSFYPIADDVIEYHEHSFYDQMQSSTTIADLNAALARITALEEQLESADTDSEDTGNSNSNDAALIVACIALLLVLAMAVFVVKRKPEVVRTGSPVKGGDVMMDDVRAIAN